VYFTGFLVFLPSIRPVMAVFWPPHGHPCYAANRGVPVTVASSFSLDYVAEIN